MLVQGIKKEEISAGVEIVYRRRKDRITELDKELMKENLWSPLVERYRAKSNSLKNVKDLLKEEIDDIDKEYQFDNIISVKFTG